MRCARNTGVALRLLALFLGRPNDIREVFLRKFTAPGNWQVVLAPVTAQPGVPISIALWLVCNPLDDMHLPVLAIVINHMNSSSGIDGTFGLSAHSKVEPPLDADHIRFGAVGNDVGVPVRLQPIHTAHVLSRSGRTLADSAATRQGSNHSLRFRPVRNEFRTVAACHSRGLANAEGTKIRNRRTHPIRVIRPSFRYG
jgi:hypothetical protein